MNLHLLDLRELLYANLKINLKYISYILYVVC